MFNPGAYSFYQLVIIFGIALLLFEGCGKKIYNEYRFFVAGHTYGVKHKPIPGLHLPFVGEFERLNADSSLRFGVLAGDIVYYSRDTSWDNVDRQLEYLEVPVYFATGNHDEGHKSPYKDRYGRTYYAFEQEGDLCIVLNPGLGAWSIIGDQMEFLKEQLSKADKYHNIFIFFHHLLWWTADNQYRDYPPNSLDGRRPEINFWTEVVPMLQDCGKNVYCFAGDVGAAGRRTVFFADKFDQIHFIATGMGNGAQDNYVLVTVRADKSVEPKVRFIQKKTEQLIFTKE